MSGLPVELWTQVFCYLEDQSPGSLKSIVRVCRCFYSLGLPILFSTLRVSNGDPKYNFIALSTKPRLAKHVRTVFIDGNGATPYFHRLYIDSGDFKLALADKYEKDVALIKIASTPFTYGRYTIGCAPSARTTAKEKFVYWHQDHLMQSVYFRFANGRDIDLSVFPNLSAVETDLAIFIQGQSFIAMKDYMRGHIEHEGMHRDTTSDRTSPSLLDLWRISAYDIGANVVTVTLHRIQEILLSRPEKFGYVTPKTVKHLKIDISTSIWTDREEWESRQGSKTIIAPWLTQMSGLETFTLIQNPHLDPPINVLRELQLKKSHSIQSVDLVHVTTSGNQLLRFANNHIGSLRGLRIHEPVLCSEEWELYRGFLKARSWSLEILELSDEYRPEGMARLDWDRKVARTAYVPHRPYSDSPDDDWMSIW